MSPKTKTGNKQVEILIVEDSPTQAEQLKYLLEKHKYKVSVANNGSQALSIFGKHKPALVISDIVMPDMTGSECISTLRRMDPHIKFIVATGAGGTDTQTLLRGDRIVGLVRKPFDEDDLLRVIGAA